MGVRRLIAQHKILQDPLKDQFFLVNEDLINRTVVLGQLSKDDVVLEVGAGVGNLTKALAKEVGKVIAFEIDSQFKPILEDLPKNVELHFENAWNYVQLHGKFRKKKEYNKVIANLPYSFCEPFLHNLTFLNYDKVILLIPLSFLGTIKTHPIFQSFFVPEEKFIVGKENFFPIPNTKSVVIDLLKIPDPLLSKNLPLFLRQYIYQHEDQLVKNSLTEGLITFGRLAYDLKLTKNEARKLISNSQIDKDLLESQPNSSEIYDQISSRDLDFPLK